MTTKPGTKLCLLSNDKGVTYVDNVVINHWSDLNIMHVKSKSDGPEHLEELHAAVSEHVQRNGLKMPLVFVGDEIDIEIYHLGEEKPVDENQLQLELEV